IEDKSQQKVNRKFAVVRDDEAARISDVKGEKPVKTEQPKYLEPASLIKLGKVMPEISDLISQSGKANTTGESIVFEKTRASVGKRKYRSAATPERMTRAPALRTEGAPLRRHSKGTPDMQSGSLERSKVSSLDSLQRPQTIAAD
ncbi:hypothetical protein FRX31_017059, partial [Thalictrum thalictroides]